MGKVYDEIDRGLQDFIGRQHVFFVGTAPTSPEGHLNVSPKGLDTFRILGPRSVAYLDLTGSGIETVAHLRENGRITIMFCAFEGRPLILRLHGRGRVVEPSDAEWEALIAQFPDYPGAVRSSSWTWNASPTRAAMPCRATSTRPNARSSSHGPTARVRRDSRNTRSRRTGPASMGWRGSGRREATDDERARPDDPDRGGRRR